MATVRLSDWLMARLADLGVREVFLLPGGGAMHLNDGLACEKRLVPVPCHHEQACGIAAEAWGRSRNTFGVCLVTTGPGATNAITPVAGAWIDSVPMLVISGQVKRADLLGDRPLRQGGVQEVDIVSMVRPVTKYAVTITDPMRIRYHLERALHEMQHSRPGPVWLDIPLDVQAAMIDPDALEGFVPDTPPSSTPDVSNVITLLAGAKRPLVLAGHGVRLANAGDRLVRLAERLGIPVVTTWNALDLLPWEHPLNVGRPGVVALRAPNFAVQNCDLLIAIGSRLDNVVTAYNARGFARAARKVIVDVDAAEIAKLDMDIDVALAADAGAFLDAIDAQAEARGAGMSERFADWRHRCADWKRRYPANDGQPFPIAGPIGHGHFVQALSDAVPADTPIATGSSGLAVEVLYANFRNKLGQRIFLTSGLGAMGYGLPAAIGICLAHDRRPTIAVESDGSLQLNIQEFATLTALGLPITLIVMNNAGYASIRNTQRNYFHGRYVGTGPEAGLHLPDLEKLAAVFGLSYTRIDDAADLTGQIKAAMAAPAPGICDVRLVKDESLWPKVAALPQPDGSMLSMPLEDMSPLLPLAQLQAEMLIPLSEASIKARTHG
jgi:acetolactate synthase I/II/III large subunit